MTQRDLGMLDELVDVLRETGGPAEHAQERARLAIEQREARGPARTFSPKAILFLVAVLSVILVPFIPGLSTGILVQAAIIVGVFGAGIVAASVVGWRANAFIRIDKGCCGRCGYDLSAHADAFDPALVSRDRIGPSVCPECGRAWPLSP